LLQRIVSVCASTLAKGTFSRSPNESCFVSLARIVAGLGHLDEPRLLAAAIASAGGPAAQAGIRPGDRILSVTGAPVATVAQLRDRVKAAGDEVALLIQREDARVFVPLRLG
jgi:S1-C subfamily serine protease